MLDIGSASPSTQLRAIKTKSLRRRAIGRLRLVYRRVARIVKDSGVAEPGGGVGGGCGVDASGSLR